MYLLFPLAMMLMAAAGLVAGTVLAVFAAVLLTVFACVEWRAFWIIRESVDDPRA